MKSLWSDSEADEFRLMYAADHGEDLALRVYTSRLIGRDQSLVLHGGGNTSVKTSTRNLLGEELSVIGVKGSGWDLVDIEPAGLPLLELPPLQKLNDLQSLSDEEMVNQVRIRLLDASAPTPSVETLLHAALPHKFVDHTHADSILVLTNQPDGGAVVRKALGDKVQVLDWIMPGFPLAKAVAQCYAEHPDCEGIVLLKHGIFTFAEDAKTSYQAMIRLVDRAERYIQENMQSPTMLEVAVSADVVAAAAETAAEVLPRIRGALQPMQLVAEWRGDSDLLAFVQHSDCRALLSQGPITPDHVIRTKGPYLVLSQAQAQDAKQIAAAVDAYASDYQGYFAANKERVALPPQMLDPLPRVVVVEGVGLLAFGANKKAACIAADIAEHTLRAKAQAAAIGCYEVISPAELFEMEYWSLEQAKLGKKKPAKLQGQVALITGAGGAIGHGIADSLLAAGAHVFLTDRDEELLAKAMTELQTRHDQSLLASCVMDVTDAAQVDAAFAACCLAFGGLDILVPNAGIAHVSRLADMDPTIFRKVVDVNLTGTMLVLQAAAKLYAQQQSGGCVVIQASKNVFAPGEAFGAYSASKAGAHQLGKIAALELAPLGVRVNMINADAVFGDQVPSGLWQEVGPERMQSRGLDEKGLRDFYKNRSLLKIAITPAEVGEAVVYLATAKATTGATLPVDGGVAGAFPR